ncbi:sugar porter family MFS transporter [Aspergillus clavatus NRRL 1]|uniref:Probable quinate permease n=1 Tax=Aspergillus clavatus (strain ATCC 1007 / CBS 513.65 / DSM 816 / NCTC 3887 / NRRL 1 / QM 1276 / 107) TaxID=344612 RepID=A1CS50_ASPCL|nr:sugar transporter [Aspergillus clavatus NRRL 1]EAW08471.1 sugar transporter [Aspergillus clavatus NRRL 1]
MKLPTFPKIYNVYFVAIVATVGGMLFGFDISSMSAIIGTQQYIDFFDNPHGVKQGAINSALAAGSVFGSIIAGPISDKIGRRDSIMFACLWWLVGTAVQAGVSGFGTLMAGRVLNGVCVGITSSQVPVYLAEISKKEKRGSLIVIQQLAIEWGIFIMFFVGYGCKFIAGPASFRLAWGLQFVPCVLLMIGLPFLPESPRWLAKVDRTEEAITTLARIQAKGNVDDPLVVAEWEEITTVLAAERAAVPGWRKFFHNGMWRRTMAGFTCQAWQQLSGANVMTYYVVYVFQMANLSGNILLISSGIQYALFIIFTSVIFFYIDKTSRRNLLIYGALGMAVCHFVVGGVLSSGEYVPGGVDGNLNVLIRVRGSSAHTVIAFSYLLIIIYALTLAPVAWVYAAEVWSLETRASGMSIAAVGNWLFNFALGLFVPPGFANIKWKLFIVFGVLCVGAAVQVFFTYPETCGKTLEEVEEMFSKNGPKPWHTKPGQSKLDHLIEEAREKGLHVKDVGAKADLEMVENVEKTAGTTTEKAADASV